MQISPSTSNIQGHSLCIGSKPSFALGSSPSFSLFRGQRGNLLGLQAMLPQGASFLLLFLCQGFVLMKAETRSASAEQTMDGLWNLDGVPTPGEFQDHGERRLVPGRLRLQFYQALSLPLPTQLPKEDEKVIKCISEILADTLSSPSPIPVTSECMKILREDERVLAMLHHRHLLTELEELAHQENAKHRLDHESDHNAWEEEQQGDIKKRDEPAQQKEATPEKVEEHADKREEEEEEVEEEEEEEEMKKYEKTKNTKEKMKVSQGEDLRETLEEQAEEEQQEEKEIKKRSSSETWSSKEYFGHVKKRGPRQPKTRMGMLQGDEEGRKRHEMVKRRFRLDEEENDDTSEEEEPKKYHRGGYSDHEKREEEEKRSDMAKRVAEKASDEETAQFEEEEKEKGLKISNSEAHLHKGWKPWQEEAEEENHSKMRHGHHHKSVGPDLRKRHWKDEVSLSGRHHAPDDEEDKEASQSKAQELDKLEEIERELKWAADKLEELKRG